MSFFDQLFSLPACVILTTGRTGSDFLQSLLDSHPQVLTFNGHLQFHLFWRTSICVASGEFLLSDFIEEFIGKHIEKFKSRYDLIEGKDRLGVSRDQSIDIDTSIYKDNFLKIMKGEYINSKTCLLGVYGAYALTLNQNLKSKKLILHHLHHHDELEYFIKDFPNCKLISMTRDPRANYFSGVTHHKKYNPDSMNGVHHYFYIKRIIEDISPLKKLKNDYVSIKLEDLGDVNILKKISKWLNIDYNETMLQSTWSGLVWNADRLTVQERTGTGFCKEILNNNWENSLSRKDIYILDFMMMNRLKCYQYKYNNRAIFSYLIIPFLIILPMGFEKRWFDVFDKNVTLKTFIFDFYFFIKRCFYFYGVYIKIIRGERFSGKIINNT